MATVRELIGLFHPAVLRSRFWLRITYNGAVSELDGGADVIDFQTSPDRYRHWKLSLGWSGRHFGDGCGREWRNQDQIPSSS